MSGYSSCSSLSSERVHNIEKIRETGKLVHVKYAFSASICSLNSKVYVVKCQLGLLNSYGPDANFYLLQDMAALRKNIIISAYFV